MGLDMYLTARRSYYEFRGDVKPKVPEVPEGFEVQAVEVEAAYWRKANAIHAWFVRTVQGGKDECQSADVSGAQLKALRDLCVELLKDRNPAAAAEKMPPQSGFFFGSTEIGEYYWADLQDTVDQIDKAMAGMPPWIEGVEPAGRWEYTYQSSW